MRLSRNEMIVVGLVILYVAFFTHPPPSHFVNLLESPIGHIIVLLGILYVAVYQSLITGVFLGIAYIMTANSVTEYMDPKEQTPKKKEPAQPTSNGIPSPAVTGAMKTLLKGDIRLPQASEKSDTTKPKQSNVSHPKPSSPPPTTKSGVENFASF